MAEKKKRADFEASLARLEEIVRRLDGGKDGLEASLKLYEEGIALVRECTSALDAAEQKMKVVSLQPDGTAVLVDADGEEDEK